MFAKLKKLLEPLPSPPIVSRPPTPLPLTAEEQAVRDKILSYPLASWNITQGTAGLSERTTTLHTMNPSGSKVEVMRKDRHYTTYDDQDRSSPNTDTTYSLRIDGQDLSNLGYVLLSSLYSTLKLRVENDPGNRQRLEDEVKAREAAQAVA